MKKFFLLCFLTTCLIAQGQVNLLPVPSNPFQEAAYSDTTNTLVLSEDFEYYVLFSQGDTVETNNGLLSPAKGSHDYTAFIPGKSHKQAFLLVSHECNDSNSTLGDGGGATVFPIRKKDFQWKRTGAFRAIDFSSVGGTYDNCGGLYIPKTKRILSAEEHPPLNNNVLYRRGKGTRDTSNLGSLQRYENMGWMVEIDPFSHAAIKKLHALGRFSHESAWLNAEGTVLYMTDDHAPGVFFKFVSEIPHSFDKGALYAYDQYNESNHWISLPGELDSLVNIRDIAIRRGATLFARMEWITAVNDQLFITETGTVPLCLSAHGLKKEQLAQHLQSYLHNDTLFYPDGSLLFFNPASDILSVKLSGGRGTKDTNKYFSNPDAITSFKSNGTNWLVICEDQIKEENSETLYNEVWWLDAGIAKPSVDSLHRFLTAPRGSEPTGVCLSTDKRTLFLNIQHPSPNNPPPFHRSCTLAIRSKSWKATYKEGKGIDISFW